MDVLTALKHKSAPPRHTSGVSKEDFILKGGEGSSRKTNKDVTVFKCSMCIMKKSDFCDVMKILL